MRRAVLGFTSGLVLATSLQALGCVPNCDVPFRALHGTYDAVLAEEFDGHLAPLPGAEEDVVAQVELRDREVVVRWIGADDERIYDVAR